MNLDRSEEKIELIRKYLQVTKQFRNYNDQSQDPHYSKVIFDDFINKKKTKNSRKTITNISFFVINKPNKQIIELDLSTIVTSVSGPKRPHDRVAVSNMQEDFRSCLTNKVRAK